MTINESIVSVIIVLTGIFVVYSVFKLIWDVSLKYKVEFKRISKGDVYMKESSDPWNKENYIYTIEDKKDGWVKVYRPRDPGYVETMRVVNLLNSGYKCIKRNKQ